MEKEVSRETSWIARENARLEYKFCLAAIPAALLAGVLLNWSMPMLVRIVFGMPVHEVGHASVAWLCGYWSIPIPWKAITAQSRGFVAPLLVLGALGYLMLRGWRAQSRLLLALGGTLLALQAIGTLFIKPKTAMMLVVFGGDGGGMVLATLLMACFFFGKETQLYQGSLRWGFVFIGGAAFMDMFGTWVAARRDFGRIPFGEAEGTGLSDATKLVDDYGWSIDALLHRHLAVGIACLAALAAVYAWGVLRARAAAT